MKDDGPALIAKGGFNAPDDEAVAFTTLVEGGDVFDCRREKKSAPEPKSLGVSPGVAWGVVIPLRVGGIVFMSAIQCPST